ncbi:hypothetical protein ACFOZ7_17790 [Natribaculum luteum]|uniref:Uncharacterized protein n=1 Tax=Natribaculum luteum TaxID=1586232 RepID=A0ABD5P3Z6_9EURY|nr:hypothetical protein [Natribaculum luteum]
MWYGTPEQVTGLEDAVGEAAIENALDKLARVAVVTETDAQAEYVDSEYDVGGTVSIETLAAEDDDFELVDPLPPPESPDLLTVGAYSNKTLKPLGKAVGSLLKTPNNPEVIFERAGQGTLGVSAMLCAPFEGGMIYPEYISGQRYPFYAPQVWMRQRRIIIQTT